MAHLKIAACISGMKNNKKTGIWLEKEGDILCRRYRYWMNRP